MERTKAQKILGIFATIEFIFGIIFVLLAVLIAIGFGYASSVDANIAQEISSSISEIGIGLFKFTVNAILVFIQWKALKDCSKDASKHHRAWTITLFVLAFEIMNFITNLGVGVPREFGTLVSSIIINCFILYLTARVRIEAEENGTLKGE